MSVTTVKCPTCGEAVEWVESSAYRPFCSKQCQLIDFGDWADESNAIPSTPDVSDSEAWQES